MPCVPLCSQHPARAGHIAGALKMFADPLGFPSSQPHLSKAAGLGSPLSAPPKQKEVHQLWV